MSGIPCYFFNLDVDGHVLEVNSSSGPSTCPRSVLPVFLLSEVMVRGVVLWHWVALSRGSPSCSRKVGAAPDRDKWSLSLGLDDRPELGSFDFFDLRRDWLDWAPNAMLQHDGKVLVAGEHGNLNEPFDTDISSPIVQHLSHGLAAAAGCGVIFTFNRVSRHVSLQDVVQEPPSRLYDRRLQRVTKCAVQCRTGGLVRVNRVYIPANVVKANGSAVFSPLNHRDRSVNLQGRTFYRAGGYTHSALTTHSAGHNKTLDVRLTHIFVD